MMTNEQKKEFLELVSAEKVRLKKELENLLTFAFNNKNQVDLIMNHVRAMISNEYRIWELRPFATANESAIKETSNKVNVEDKEK